MISNILVWVSYSFFILKSTGKIKFVINSIFILLFMYFTIGKSFNENITENENYLKNTGVEGNVRLGMYFASFRIAKDYFPLGSGMGTFGSLASIIKGYYSPLYYEYHVSNIGANSQEDVAVGHHTLLDTYWPHIFGELGFLGTLLFLLIWFFPLNKSIFNLRNSNEPFRKGISFFIVLIIISMTWEGFSLYTPEVPAFILLHSGLTGLCYYHIK